MNTNRSGLKPVSVAKVRHLMHEMFTRGMHAGVNGSDKLPPLELQQLRLRTIREVLQESN